jgi:hypothetical protein
LSGKDFIADVACFNARGSALDAAFVVAVIPDADAPDNLGYAWTNQASATEVPVATYSHHPSAGAINKTRLGTGRYEVRFANLANGIEGGHVQITAYDAPGSFCQIVSWNATTQDMTARVNCFNAGGLRADARFQILAVPTPTKFTNTEHRLVSVRSAGTTALTGDSIALAVSDGAFPVPVAGVRPDRDGDSLPDVWETTGLDFNNDGTIDLNLAALGADPDHKDVFVEIDSIAGFAPSAQALDMVKSAFANVPPTLIYNPDGKPGINLHLMVDDTIPATRGNRQFPGDPVEAWKAFKKIRTEYFGTAAQRQSGNSRNILAAKDLVFRYALFGDRRGTQGRAGLGETPGRNLMVTLGGWKTPGGTVEQQAGVLMHELGHTLGLDHGGDDAGQFKPNYLSVMSYSHLDGATIVNGKPLIDFSRYAPNAPDPAYRNVALDERALNELVGLGFPPHVDFDFELGYFRAVGSGGSVDWNENGILRETTSVDVNNARPGELLKSYNDWGNLIFGFQRYHSDSDAEGYPRHPDDDGDTSDICTKRHSEHLPSGSDPWECNDIPSEAKGIVDGDWVIQGPEDEDWYIIDALVGLDILNVTIDPSQNLEEAPDVTVALWEPLTDNMNLKSVPLVVSSNGLSTEYSAGATTPNEFYLQIKGINNTIFAPYRLTSTIISNPGTVRWSGSVDARWSTPGNWVGNNVPPPGSHIVFPANASRTTIDVDDPRLVSSLTFERNFELRSTVNATLVLVTGGITVGSQATATFDPSITLSGGVIQNGAGRVVLNGQANGWTIRENGSLSGRGGVDQLTVNPTATFSAGDGAGSFTVRDLLDLRGTLLVDVLPHRDTAAQLDMVQAARTELAPSSQLRFQIRHNPGDVPNPLNPLATGPYTRSILSSLTITGQFGNLPGLGAHLDRGVFFQKLASSNAGPTRFIDVSLLQAVPGDADGQDGFGTSDLVQVLAAGQYEDAINGNSNWQTGDWNHDGDFTTADLITALQTGLYETGVGASIGAFDRLPGRHLLFSERTARRRSL